MLRLAWFSTGRGPGSRQLLAAVQGEIASGRLNAEIAVVYCNRERGEDANTDLFLDQVTNYGLPLECLSSRRFRKDRDGQPARKDEPLPEWRREYDREVMKRLDRYEFDLGMLAGYMLIFCDDVAEKHNLLNLHPAAPGGPKGIWQDIIWELIQRRADRAGVMVHLATSALDEGPPVTFCTYPLRGPGFDALWREVEAQDLDKLRKEQGEQNGLFAEIRRQGVAREAPLLIETLRSFVAGQITIKNKTVVDAAGRPIGPQNLTGEIERVIAAA